MADWEGNVVARQARILLVSGSTRGASTNTAALRTLLAVAPEWVNATLYTGLADLPAFNPDDDREPLPPAAAGLRQQIAAADAVLFCTPEYAGGLPGSLKNLLDWTVGGGEMYGKPVAWINVAAEGRGPARRSRSPGCLATWAPPPSNRPAVICPWHGRRPGRARQ